jgi:hypothetical protein
MIETGRVILHLFLQLRINSGFSLVAFAFESCLKLVDIVIRETSVAQGSGTY